MSCALLILLGYVVVGFILISLFTKYATKRFIYIDDFILGVIIWPIIVFFVITDFIGDTLDKLVSSKFFKYLEWLQKDKK